MMRSLIASLLGLVLVGGTARADFSFQLDFNQPGVLPSSSGFTYGAIPPNLSETFIFNVGPSGHLNMDTAAVGGVSAYYYLAPAAAAYEVDSDLDLKFSLNALFLSGNGFGFTLIDQHGPSSALLGLQFSPGTIAVQTSTGSQDVSFNPVGDFHTYELVSAGGSYTYNLFIDGALARSGMFAPISSGIFGESLAFGDLTSTGGDADVLVDYITYANVSAVPEPASLILFGLGGVLSLAVGYRRRGYS